MNIPVDWVGKPQAEYAWDQLPPQVHSAMTLWCVDYESKWIPIDLKFNP